jgi:hypothetical protein
MGRRDNPDVHADRSRRSQALELALKELVTSLAPDPRDVAAWLDRAVAPRGSGSVDTGSYIGTHLANTSHLSLSWCGTEEAL